ncbi:MAG TPA: hypothetical protein VGC04_13240 [Cellulomonas sp.]
MAEVEADLTTIDLSGQVLGRQAEHCRAAASYLAANGSIVGSTGLILAPLGAAAEVVLGLGTGGLRTAASMCDATSHAARSTFSAYVQVDEDVQRRFARLGADLVSGWQGGGRAPSPGSVSLGPAVDGAPNGWGDTDSWFWEKAQTTGQSVDDVIGDLLGLGSDITAWGSNGGTITEAVDAESFLVVPTADDNWAQDMRWSAGAVLGGIDWVFEQLCGYSILEELIFKPFAGDSRDVTKAAGAWTSTGAALSAVGLNHARLVSSTVETWRGDAADAFRVAMGLIAEGFHRLSGLCDTVSSALTAVAVGMKAICAAIGAGLKALAQLLLDIAAQAAVPVAGWAVLAATAYWKVERIVTIARTIYTLIETAFTLISTFVQTKTSVVGDLARFEDLAEGVFRRASQGATS